MTSVLGFLVLGCYVSMQVPNFKVTPKRLETRCPSQESVDQEVKCSLGFSRVLCRVSRVVTRNQTSKVHRVSFI